MVDLDIELGGPEPDVINDSRAPEGPVPVSPLYAVAGQRIESDAFSLSECEHQHKIIVRGDAEDQNFSSAVQQVTGLALPISPNQAVRTSDDQAELVWLGPDEWLYRTSAQSDVNLLIQAFREKLAGIHAAIVDVSDYYVCLRVSGSKVIQVLRKMTPLDLASALNTPGGCAQSCFGQATVLVTQGSDDELVLQVRWSFAEYVWTYLLEASREFTQTST